MHTGRPNHWSQKHLWITSEFGSFGFATERIISKMNLLKISGLREPPGRLGDQAQELGRNRGRPCTKALASIPLQNGWVGILLLPTRHCGQHGCWCWTLILLATLPLLEKNDPLPHTPLSSAPVPMVTYNWWAQCTHKSVLYLEGMLGMWVHYLCRRSYTEGNSPNMGRPVGPPKTWPISTIRLIFFFNLRIEVFHQWQHSSIWQWYLSFLRILTEFLNCLG